MHKRREMFEGLRSWLNKRSDRRKLERDGKLIRKISDGRAKKVATASKDGISWVGWIRGPRSAEWQLRCLGVQGLMIHSYSEAHGGTFEHCVCDTSAMERLRKEYPPFWPGTFTGVGINGEQLPREQQKYGGMYG